MPYKDRTKKNAVTKRYRDRMRERAIAALGGTCQCGFTGNPLAFDILNDPPLQRGGSGRSRRDGLGPRQHRRIIEGDHAGVLLLCGRCSNIRTRSNGGIHANLPTPTPPEVATAPATPARPCAGLKREVG